MTNISRGKLYSIFCKIIIIGHCSCFWISQVSTILCCSVPGRYEAMQKEIDYVKQLWKNRQELKVENLGIAALFGLECYAWYCAGEIVGRGFTFTGYYPWALRIWLKIFVGVITIWKLSLIFSDFIVTRTSNRYMFLYFGQFSNLRNSG